VTELGGKIVYEPRGGQIWPDSTPPGSPWLRRLVGDDYFQYVEKVHLDNTDVTDADLRSIMGRLRKVRRLSLNFTDVSDVGLAHLSTVRQLRYLGLAETRITGDGLQYIAGCGRLEELVLENTAVGDDELKHLKELTELEFVNLSGTRVTSAGIADLASLVNLVQLYAYDTPVDDSAIPHFKRMNGRITELHVSGSQFSGRGLLVLQHALPSCNISCEMLDLSGSKYCRTKWTKLVGRMHEVDCEGRLKALDLSDATVSDEDVALLHGLENVQIIDLRGTSVSENACAKLRSALPHCHVCR